MINFIDLGIRRGTRILLDKAKVSKTGTLNPVFPFITISFATPKSKHTTGVPDAIPVVGSSLVELLRGGTSVGQATLTRFYSLHTFVLPLITAVLMLAHFLMIRKQGISGPL